MREVKMVLPASEIPENAIVSKVTGKNEYVLKNSIRVFLKEGSTEATEIKAESGCRFLLNPNTGDANAIAGTKELVWHVLDRDLYAWLDDRLNAMEDK